MSSFPSLTAQLHLCSSRTTSSRAVGFGEDVVPYCVVLYLPRVDITSQDSAVQGRPPQPLKRGPRASDAWLQYTQSLTQQGNNPACKHRRRRTAAMTTPSQVIGRVCSRASSNTVEDTGISGSDSGSHGVSEELLIAP